MEISKKEKQLEQGIGGLARENAKIREKMFRDSNKDVSANSEEERQIAQLISAGVPEDKAAWAVMGPKRVAEAERKGTKTTKATKEMKSRANVETQSIPAKSGIPTKKSFREELKEKMGIA